MLTINIMEITDPYYPKYLKYKYKYLLELNGGQETENTLKLKSQIGGPSKFKNLKNKIKSKPKKTDEQKLATTYKKCNDKLIKCKKSSPSQDQSAPVGNFKDCKLKVVKSNVVLACEK